VTPSSSSSVICAGRSWTVTGSGWKGLGASLETRGFMRRPRADHGMPPGDEQTLSDSEIADRIREETGAQGRVPISAVEQVRNRRQEVRRQRQQARQEARQRLRSEVVSQSPGVTEDEVTITETEDGFEAELDPSVEAVQGVEGVDDDLLNAALPENQTSEIQDFEQALEEAGPEVRQEFDDVIRDFREKRQEFKEGVSETFTEADPDDVASSTENLLEITNDLDSEDVEQDLEEFEEEAESERQVEVAEDLVGSAADAFDEDSIDTAVGNIDRDADEVTAVAEEIARDEEEVDRLEEQVRQRIQNQELGLQQQEEDTEADTGFEAPGPEVRQATRNLRERVSEETGLDEADVRIDQTTREDGGVRLEARAADGATVTETVQDNQGGSEDDGLSPAEEIDALLPDSAVSEQESRRQDQESRRQDQEAFQTLAQSSFEETTAFVEGEDTSDTVGVTDTLTRGALRERAAREELEGTGLQPVASAVGSTATIQTQVTEAIDDSSLSDVIDPVADDFVDRTGETTDTPGPTAVNREFDLLQQPRGEERLERRQRERRSQATSGAASIVTDTPVIATQTLALTESVARNPSNLEDFAGRVGPGFQQSFVEPAEEDPTGFFLEEVGPEVVAAGVGAGAGAGAATVSSRATSVPETPASSTETVDAPIQTRTETTPDEVDFDDTAFNEDVFQTVGQEQESQVAGTNTDNTRVRQVPQSRNQQPDRRRPGQQASQQQRRQRAEQFLTQTDTVESRQNTESIELNPAEARMLSERQGSSLDILGVTTSQRGGRVVVEVPEGQRGNVLTALQRFQEDFVDNANLGSGPGAFVPREGSQTSSVTELDDFVDEQETNNVVDPVETGRRNRDIESIGQNEPNNPDLQDAGSRTETQNEVFDAELPRLDLNQGIGVGLGLNAAATPGLAQSEDTLQTPRPDQRQSPFEDEDTDTSQDLGQELIQDTQTSPGLGPRQGNVFDPVDRSNRDQQRNTDTNRNRNRRRDIDLPDIDLGEDEDEEEDVFGFEEDEDAAESEFTTSLVGESFGVGVTDEEAEGDTLTGLEGRIR